MRLWSSKVLQNRVQGRLLPPDPGWGGDICLHGFSQWHNCMLSYKGVFALPGVPSYLAVTSFREECRVLIISVFVHFRMKTMLMIIRINQDIAGWMPGLRYTVSLRQLTDIELRSQILDFLGLILFRSEVLGNIHHAFIRREEVESL